MRRLVFALVITIATGCGDDGTQGISTPALLWEDLHDEGAGGVRTHDVATSVAVCDGRLYVAGNSAPEVDGGAEVIVRAYDARDGMLLWHDRLASGTDDDARSIACQREHVVVLLRRSDTAVLRTHDARNGTLLWALEEEGRSNSYASVHVDGDLVFFYAPSVTTSEGEVVAILRALDAGSGTVVWEDRHELTPRSNFAFGGIGTSGTRVCVGREAHDEEDRSIRCLDKASGAVIWQDVIGHIGQGSSLTPSFVLDGKLVVMAGVDGERSFLKAYAANDGRPIWEREYPAFTTIGIAGTVGDLVLASGVEFVLDGEGHHDYDVTFADALDARSGEVVWQDRREGPNADLSALSGGELIVAGIHGEIFVYDARTGRLLIEEPEPGRYGAVHGVAAEAGRYFLAGPLYDGSADGKADFAVHAFAAD